MEDAETPSKPPSGDDSNSTTTATKSPPHPSNLNDTVTKAEPNGAVLNTNSSRGASPGVAKRVVTATPDTDKTNSDEPPSSIDDLSQRFAENLLERPTAAPAKTDYVSINQQLKEKRKRELAERLANSEVVAPAVNALEHLPAVHTSSSYTQLSNGCNGLGTVSAEAISIDQSRSPGAQNSHNNSSPIPSSHLMDGSVLNMSKPGFNASTSLNSDTLWGNSNGVAGGVDKKDTEGLDLLTAMSGEPAPNTLPSVADGLSDGEVSSESEAEDGGTVDAISQQANEVGIKQQAANVDSFFAQHESIMKSKTAEQVAAMQATILDIQQAVREGKRIDHETDPDRLLQLFNPPSAPRSTSPIWEIRESYAETLKQQEAKRKKRMELEHRYEREYRDRQMLEIERIEAEGSRNLTAQTLDDGIVETINTDYYSSEEEDMADTDTSRWGSGAKYARLGETDKPTMLPPSHPAMHTSNASRLADHDLSTSPMSSRRPAFRGEVRSNSSFSSSSPSSVAPSTVVHCNVHGSMSPVNRNDSSSSNSWDEGDEDPPTTLLPSGHRKKREQGDYDTDEETDRLLNKPYQGEARVDLPADTQELGSQAMKNKAKEVTVYDPDEPTVLIEGILFRAAYLGSTQLMSEAQPSRAVRMMQAQEAVGRIKAADGESQPSTDVDLFVSTEKVMVLNTDLQEIMMDHALRSISYIADIDNILVIMAKRSLVTGSSSSGDEQTTPSLPSGAQQKLICHIFETDEAQLIAQSIGQAFQVAYMEFLKANGIEDADFHMKNASYEDILEQQEVMNDELETFTRKDKQKDVIVPKAKGEALGIVIVESGWGSVLPTVVLANMSPTAAAARCGQLNIGDQIMSVNGISLVGLPLSTCQEHVKAVKNLTAVRLCVVSRPPVVDVLIKRPDRKYQLGFSVQNGVICSLLRGGIAERGGIRVGHRIIEINGQSVVAVAHEKIVHMLSTSVGEIHMKTMPMAVFRLLTGQEVPQYI